MTYRSPRGDVRSVWIVDVRPELDGGRFPVKREVGDLFEVSADILQEGHGNLAAVLRYRTVKDTAWHEAPMEPLGNDRWAGRFLLEENTRAGLGHDLPVEAHGETRFKSRSQPVHVYSVGGGPGA